MEASVTANRCEAIPLQKGLSMIVQVLRISTVFANMMAAATFALAITIAVAGTVERTRAGCYGCLHASAALRVAPGLPAATAAPSPMQAAFGARRVIASLE